MIILVELYRIERTHGELTIGYETSIQECHQAITIRHTLECVVVRCAKQRGGGRR